MTYQRKGFGRSMGRRYEYEAGHVETVSEYMNRGGQVRRMSGVGFSRHLTEEATLLSVLCGGSVEDGERGFAWADFTPELREVIASRTLGLDQFDDVVAEEQ